MSNPDGDTGYRSVKYVKPNETIVYYNDRELKIETKGESNEDFASKVKARTGKVPEGYKTRAQAYAERRAAAKEKREAALSQKRKARSGKAGTSKTAPKTASKTTAKTASKGRTAKPRAAPRTTKSKTAPRPVKKMNALEAGLASGKYRLE